MPEALLCCHPAADGTTSSYIGRPPGPYVVPLLATVAYTHEKVRLVTATGYMQRVLTDSCVLSMGIESGGGVGGGEWRGRVPFSEKFRRGRHPRFENEVAEIRSLFRFLGYFGY